MDNIEFADTSDDDDVFENTYANIDHLKQPTKPEPIYATVKKRPKQSPKVEDTEKDIKVEQKKPSPAERKAKVATVAAAPAATASSTTASAATTPIVTAAAVAATASVASSSVGVKKPAPQETPQPPTGDVTAPDSEEGTEAVSGLSPTMVPLPVFLVLTRHVTSSFASYRSLCSRMELFACLFI